MAITSNHATIIVLDLLVKQTEKLFTSKEWETDIKVSPKDLELLRKARDLQVQRLKENLTFALKGK